ncbi:MAG: glycosyltransferase involved in cell wall biosynthesis [Pseudohongiellaceae bacterium]|jgi:glycosyltransferase involved in cell wall biosynthesis
MSSQAVAVVVPNLAVGGLQAMAVALAAALDQQRFLCKFYTFDGEGPLVESLAAAGLIHRYLPRPAGVAAEYAKRLSEMFVADDIALVHCHNITAMFHGSRAAWRAGRLPVLFTEHDREMPAPMRHRLLHRWLARRVHETATVSAGLTRDLVRLEGFSPRRTHPLLNGIPDPAEALSQTTDICERRAAARAMLGWDDRPVVLAVGTLTPVKNHTGLLDAWNQLLAARSDPARLVVAGEGPERARLEQQLSAMPKDSVKLLGTRSDVPTLLAACDLFVLPSHREGLPLCLVEAHAMSRAAVAFDTGGNNEVIVDGETGLLVPLGDLSGLATTLGRLLDDGARREAMGQRGRHRFLEHFTHERMVVDYIEVYERLLATRWN